MGILYSYVVGSLVDYFWLGILSCVIPVAFVVVFFFMPETPNYLLKKNDRAQAERSLRVLRGPTYDVKRELDVLQVCFFFLIESKLLFFLFFFRRNLTKKPVTRHPLRTSLRPKQI